MDRDSILNSLTLGDLKSLRDMFAPCPEGGGTSMRVGQKVIIRTVTNYFVGKVTGASSTEVALSDASWVADTGRYSKALAEGGSFFKEVERLPHGVTVRLGAVVDWCDWCHELPKETR